MSDWRLRGQDRYLKGVELRWSKYRIHREGWDHDHCEFCNAKFAETGGDLDHGYATRDNYHWVCETCFANFKDSFDWTVSARDDG